MSRKTKKPVESVRGTYSAMPHAVMDSPAYTGASIAAKALLNELIRQHNGGNNGRLHLSRKWLAARGWASKSIIDKTRAELIERGLIVKTKSGGLFVGADLFALTWLPITNHVGLETAPNTYHPGGWQCCDLPPTTRRKPPMKKVSRPVHRASRGPTTGPESAYTGPTTGPCEVVSGDSPGPTTGHDVLHQSPPVDYCPPKRMTIHVASQRWSSIGLLPRHAPRSTRVRIFTPANSGHTPGLTATS
jgi:hypothetical protein